MPEKNPYYGSTFAERKAIREGCSSRPAKAEPVVEKQIDADDEKAAVEDKAVKKAVTKAPEKKS